MNEKNLIRVKDYRQLKEQIRGSEEYLIVGIDISKDKHHAFLGAANGKTLLRRLILQLTVLTAFAHEHVIFPMLELLVPVNLSNKTSSGLKPYFNPNTTRSPNRSRALMVSTPYDD
jgi:hypothetical protein